MSVQSLQQVKKNAPQALRGHTIYEAEDYRDTWRIFRIMAELVEGYQFLSKYDREVTILGSARFHESYKYSRVARDLGYLLGKNNFTTITGGGGGIMEAANRGAFEAGGESLGLNIELPMEQHVNRYVKSSIGFYYFFTRKVMLTSPANAYAYFPGGFGTMDEFFEVVDQIELGLMIGVPIVLVGKEFWSPLLDFLKNNCIPIGAVKQVDIDQWHVVDTAAEAYDIIKDMPNAKDSCDLSSLSFQCEGKVDWKIFRIMAELVEGFEFLTGLTHAITVLGTKSIHATDPYYVSAYALGQALAEKGYDVVTGGKTGVAEAANKGAFEVGGKSLGIAMRIGDNTEVNPYLTKSILFSFPFTRKLVLTAPTKAFIFYPGGFGTLHQLFEVLTLIQTRKIKKLPIILVGHDFWTPLHKFIKQTLMHETHAIADEDDELYQIVDSVEGVMKVLGE